MHQATVLLAPLLLRNVAGRVHERRHLLMGRCHCRLLWDRNFPQGRRNFPQGKQVRRVGVGEHLPRLKKKNLEARSFWLSFEAKNGGRSPEFPILHFQKETFKAETVRRLCTESAPAVEKLFPSWLISLRKVRQEGSEPCKLDRGSYLH